MTQPIKILVVDDHNLFRRGLVSLLDEDTDFTVVGEAENGVMGVRLARERQPDVVLMDLNMPGGSGIDAVRSLKQSTDIRVLMLTVSQKDDDLFSALAAGADGYLLKNADLEQLRQAIYSALAGHGSLSPEITTRVIQAVAKTQHPAAFLSEREVEVLTAVARGLTTSEIAVNLVISDNTVKTHIQRILRKLDAANRSEAVARAVSLGLLPSN